MSAQFDHVSVLKQASVYFEGKCISHTIIPENGIRKTLGVILPSTLTFNMGLAEVIDVTSGISRYTKKIKRCGSNILPGEVLKPQPIPASTSKQLRP